MPVPKQRHNSSRGSRRRAGQRKLTVSKMIICSNCGQKMLSHRVCPNCGFYKGKEILTPKVKKSSKKK